MREASSPTLISSGIWTFSGRLLGDLQLEAAHLLGLLLPALVADWAVALALRCWCGTSRLPLLLLHPVCRRGDRQLLQLLVVLVQVDVAALAGVHHLAVWGTPAQWALDGDAGLAWAAGPLPWRA